MDIEQTQLLIYQHVVQLTLLDHEVDQAFALAHQVAALAFDETFTREGIAAAIERRAAPTQDQASSIDKPARTKTDKKG